jgi:hypothetical protein
MQMAGLEPASAIMAIFGAIQPPILSVRPLKKEIGKFFMIRMKRRKN